MNNFEHNDSFIVTQIEYNDKFEYNHTNSACVTDYKLLLFPCNVCSEVNIFLALAQALLSSEHFVL